MKFNFTRLIKLIILSVFVFLAVYHLPILISKEYTKLQARNACTSSSILDQIKLDAKGVKNPYSAVLNLITGYNYLTGDFIKNSDGTNLTVDVAVDKLTIKPIRPISDGTYDICSVYTVATVEYSGQQARLFINYVFGVKKRLFGLWHETVLLQFAILPMDTEEKDNFTAT